MLANNAPEMLEGVVEADETHVGGKSHNKQRGQKRFYTRVDEGQKTVDILVQTQQ